MQREVNAMLATLEAMARTCARLSRSLERELDPGLRPRRWTAEERKAIRARYPHEPTARIARDLRRPIPSVYQLAAKLRLKKSVAFLASPASGRTNGRQGVGSRFRKGITPWNKGKKGFCPPGSKKGWFKKGRKPLNTWRPIGTEITNKDGYRVRKISDRGGYNNDDWKPVHHLVWEKKRGPVPPGHALIFRNGNKRDFRLANLQLLTRSQLMKKNTIHRYPLELKQAIRALGKLKRTMRKQDERN